MDVVGYSELRRHLGLGVQHGEDGMELGDGVLHGSKGLVASRTLHCEQEPETSREVCSTHREGGDSLDLRSFVGVTDIDMALEVASRVFVVRPVDVL